MRLVNGGLGANYIYFEFGYNGLLYTLFFSLGAVVSGPIFIFFTRVSKRFTRNQLMRASIIGIVGGNLLMLLFGLLVPSSAGMFKFVLLMVGNLFAFAGQNTYYLVSMICIANTVEYNEWKTGARAEGIIFSVRPFLTKLGFAAIQLMTLVIFLLSGVRLYSNQIAEVENMANKGLFTEEGKTAAIEEILKNIPGNKNAILLICMTVIPIVILIASYYFYHKKYIITEEKYDQILAEINERNSAATAIKE